MKHKLLLLFIIVLLISGCSPYIYGEFKEGITEEEGFRDWERGCNKGGGEYKWTYPNHTMVCTVGNEGAVFIYEGEGKWRASDI